MGGNEEDSMLNGSLMPNQLLISIRSAALLGAFLAASVSADDAALRQRLSKLSDQIVYESYVDNNWELFVMDADGGNARNLTQTSDQHEIYPQVSPDGKRIAFVADKGKGRDTVRSVYVMNADGSDRKLIAEYARQPFWAPDSEVIGYLPQEYKRFHVVDYYTKGMRFHHIGTGKSWDHPNAEKIHHLYNPSFSANGKWVVSTVHAGMGHSHAILAIEAKGDGIYNLEIPGCRPCFSPDGSKVAWGPGDHEISVATLDFSGKEPKIAKKQMSVVDKVNKIYHVDWSPDGRFLTISRGPNGEGDISKPGTHSAACEIVGVHAQGWNIIAVSAEAEGTLDLNAEGAKGFVTLTDNGASNKESDWLRR